MTCVSVNVFFFLKEGILKFKLVTMKEKEVQQPLKKKNSPNGSKGSHVTHRGTRTRRVF